MINENIIYMDGIPYIKAQVILLISNEKVSRKNPIGYSLQSKGFHRNSIALNRSYRPLYKFNLYITSDEEIKEGDWYYQFLEGTQTIHQANNSSIKAIEIFSSNTHFAKKIIATTDTSLKLINLSNFGKNWMDILLAKPSQEFIEDWVTDYGKGNIITDVLVEYEKIPINIFGNRSRIIRHSEQITFKIQLKINSKNTITIHKQKDSWSREEAIELCKKAFIAGGNFEMKPFTTDLYDVYCPDIDEWIEENLQL